MPRTIDVAIRNDAVDKAKPGDKLIFTGTLVVLPDASSLANTSICIALCFLVIFVAHGTTLVSQPMGESNTGAVSGLREFGFSVTPLNQLFYNTHRGN